MASLDLPNRDFPGRIETQEQLEELLTRPSPMLIEFVRTLEGPLVILGAGGKMGPTLAVLAKRAAAAAQHSLDIIAASRFSDRAVAGKLRDHGIRTVSCDLLDGASVQSLPEAGNVIYLVGLKFGTTDDPSTTWAVNTIVPTHVAERYRAARIVALSTGNVYPMSEIRSGGARETGVLTPLGEYANSAVARERIFEFHSRAHHTAISLLRLFYAVELRYGVLGDIARKVRDGIPIDLTNGYFNCIWQGDANEMVIRALSLTAAPPSAWNLCRPEVFSVRTVATRFGELLGRVPRFARQESTTALLGDSAALCARLGEPAVSVERMMGWIADWVRAGGLDLGKPTHFETRDGHY